MVCSLPLAALALPLVMQWASPRGCCSPFHGPDSDSDSDSLSGLSSIYSVLRALGLVVILSSILFTAQCTLFTSYQDERQDVAGSNSPFFQCSKSTRASVPRDDWQTAFSAPICDQHLPMYIQKTKRSYDVPDQAQRSLFTTGAIMNYTSLSH